MEHKIEFQPSAHKQGVELVCNGYIYKKNKIRNNKTYWVCTNKSKSCPATCTTFEMSKWLHKPDETKHTCKQQTAAQIVLHRAGNIAKNEAEHATGGMKHFFESIINRELEKAIV